MALDLSKREKTGAKNPKPAEPPVVKTQTNARFIPSQRNKLLLELGCNSRSHPPHRSRPRKLGVLANLPTCLEDVEKWRIHPRGKFPDRNRGDIAQRHINASGFLSKQRPCTIRSHRPKICEHLGECYLGRGGEVPAYKRQAHRGRSQHYRAARSMPGWDLVLWLFH